MNKGLGKLILIAGLGLGALYFINKEPKNSNSNDKKLTEAKVEEFIKDEKKGQEEYKAVGLDNLAKDEKKHEEFLENIEGKSKKKKVLSEETKQRLREQLAKGRVKQKENREKNKMSKAEAGKLGGEATAELGKHKGHKSTKGLVQDQNLISKEEHEKHYQKGRFDKK